MICASTESAVYVFFRCIFGDDPVVSSDTSDNELSSFGESEDCGRVRSEALEPSLFGFSFFFFFVSVFSVSFF